MKFLKYVAIWIALAILATLVSEPLSDVDLPVVGRLESGSIVMFGPVLGLAAIVILGKLRKNHFGPGYVTRLTTNLVYFVCFVAMTLMAQSGNYAARPWYTLGAVVTACLVWRTVAQELWLRRLDRTNEQVLARKTGSFGAAGFARVSNPAFFRWGHRVLAVTWIWGTIPRLVAEGSSRQDEVLWLILMPACFLLIGGRVAATIMLIGLPLLLLFAVHGVGGVWFLLMVLWLVYAVLRAPHDGRTNRYRAFVDFERDAVWSSMH